MYAVWITDSFYAIFSSSLCKKMGFSPLGSEFLSGPKQVRVQKMRMDL
jgi:hypothetical protein